MLKKKLTPLTGLPRYSRVMYYDSYFIYLNIIPFSALLSLFYSYNSDFLPTLAPKLACLER